MVEPESFGTYKTVAHFTFPDGTVYEGVLELDSHTLQVKSNYLEPQPVDAAASGPLIEDHFWLATWRIQ